MISNFKRRIAIVFCFACLIISTVFGFSLMQASAQATPTIAENLTSEGASVRLTQVSGIKFAYSISDYNETENESTNYGMLVLPYDYLAKAGIEIVDNSVDYVKVLEQAKTDDKIPVAPVVVEGLKPVYNDELGKYVVEYSITNVLESNYCRPWFALGFIKDGDAYSYAPITEKNTRDITQVAALILHDYEKNSVIKAKLDANYSDTKTYKELVTEFVTKGVDGVLGQLGLEELPYSIEDVKTNVWKGVNDMTARIPQTKYVNLPYAWWSSNKDVATIDENGQITLVGSGSTRFDVHSSRLYSSSKTINVFDRQTPNATNEILNPTVDGGTQGYKLLSGSTNVEGVLADDTELASLTGEYTGKAIKYVSSGSAYRELSITPRITEADWDKAIADGYKKMYVWLAATTNNTSATFKTLNATNSGWMCPSPIDLSNSSTSGVWTKVMIDLDNSNKEIMFNDDGMAKLVRFYSNPSATEVTLYVGNCEFDEETRIEGHEIAFVKGESSLTNYSVDAVATKQTISLATDNELEDIAGDYNGKAIKFVVTGQAYYGITLTPRITENDWDNAEANGYTKIYVWVAGNNTLNNQLIAHNKASTSESYLFYNGTTNTTIYSSSVATQWFRFEIDLTDANKEKLFASGGAALIRFYNYSANSTAGKDEITLYIGDCGFAK